MEECGLITAQVGYLSNSRQIKIKIYSTTVLLHHSNLHHISHPHHTPTPPHTTRPDHIIRRHHPHLLGHIIPTQGHTPAIPTSVLDQLPQRVAQFVSQDALERNVALHEQADAAAVDGLNARNMFAAEVVTVEVDFSGAAAGHGADGCGAGREEERDGAFDGAAAVYAEGSGEGKDSEEEEEQEGGRDEQGRGIKVHASGRLNGGSSVLRSL